VLSDSPQLIPWPNRRSFARAYDPQLRAPSIEALQDLRHVRHQQSRGNQWIVPALFNHNQLQLGLLKHNHLAWEIEHAGVQGDESIDASSYSQLVQDLPILVVCDEIGMHLSQWPDVYIWPVLRAG